MPVSQALGNQPVQSQAVQSVGQPQSTAAAFQPNANFTSTAAPFQNAASQQQQPYNFPSRIPGGQSGLQQSSNTPFGTLSQQTNANLTPSTPNINTSSNSNSLNAMVPIGLGAVGAGAASIINGGGGTQSSVPGLVSQVASTGVKGLANLATTGSIFGAGAANAAASTGANAATAGTEFAADNTGEAAVSAAADVSGSSIGNSLGGSLMTAGAGLAGGMLGHAISNKNNEATQIATPVLSTLGGLFFGPVGAFIGGFVGSLWGPGNPTPIGTTYMVPNSTGQLTSPITNTSDGFPGSVMQQVNDYFARAMPALMNKANMTWGANMAQGVMQTSRTTSNVGSPFAVTFDKNNMTVQAPDGTQVYQGDAGPAALTQATENLYNYMVQKGYIVPNTPDAQSAYTAAYTSGNTKLQSAQALASKYTYGTQNQIELNQEGMKQLPEFSGSVYNQQNPTGGIGTGLQLAYKGIPSAVLNTNPNVYNIHVQNGQYYGEALKPDGVLGQRQDSSRNGQNTAVQWEPNLNQWVWKGSYNDSGQPIKTGGQHR